MYWLPVVGSNEQDGSWRPARQVLHASPQGVDDQVPRQVKALLLKAVKAGKIQLPPGVTELSLKSLLRRLTSVNWNVKILEQYATGTGVVKYLANYLRGGPIGNSRFDRLPGRRGKFPFSTRNSGRW